MKKRFVIIAAIISFVVLMIFSIAESAFLYLRLDVPTNDFWGFYGEGLKTSIFLILAIWLVLVMFAYIFSEKFLFALRGYVSDDEGLKKMSKHRDLALIAGKIRALSCISEESLYDSTTQIGLALNGLNQGLILLSPESKVTFCNLTAQEILGDSELGFDRIIPEKQNAIAHATINGREYEFAFAFLKDSSAVILITDITQLERLRHVKEGLIHALSNQLIAPLAAISSYAGLIKCGMSERNIKEAALVIEEESKQVSLYVKSLLADNQMPL